MPRIYYCGPRDVLSNIMVGKTVDRFMHHHPEFMFSHVIHWFQAKLPNQCFAGKIKSAIGDDPAVLLLVFCGFRM